MKLYMSKNSPYVRIVRVVLRENPKVADVTELEIDPRDPATGFWSVNPIARIPTLELDDGTVIAESDLICRHLDDMAGGALYAPLRDNASRLAILGIAQGMLDRGVAARTERMRPGGPDQAAFVETHFAAIRRAADALESIAPAAVDTPDIADIAVACTVAWLDFRHPEVDVRAGRPGLSRWFSEMDARDSMASTRPS
ncbi:glutathione S-transferase family protein [Microbaculum marinum]|uniref:Glutathione S-transferase family protein n=1 Tax=Microbaculum marinum TaxID=1764581 RepID=A0AAW9RNQ6_9HYPH